MSDWRRLFRREASPTPRGPRALEPVPTAAAASEAPASPAPVSGFDWPLFGAFAALVGLGLLMNLSASSLMADAYYGDALHFVTRQSIGLGAGLLGGLFILKMPWRLLRRGSWWAYAAVLIALALVFSPIGREANGAMRWISVGGINQQPSEYAKLVLILVLSHYLAANEGRLQDTVGVLIPALALPAPVLLLVLLEPDFGSSVILVALTGILLFLAGLRWRWIVALGASAVAALAVLILIEPYRMRRLTSFTDPFADVEGAGYQVIQGWIALANGGMFGQGLASGVAQRGFLPEAHTDFISAVIGEELGAVGFAGMTLLYVAIVWRGVVIAGRSQDLYGTLVAMAITSLFGMQAIVNLGVVVGWLPAKGLVLPFLSYGASAITVHVLCMATLLRVGMASYTVDTPAAAVSPPPRPALGGA